MPSRLECQRKSDQEYELLTYGYCRNIKYCNIPTVVMDVIFEYCKNYFQWKGNNITTGSSIKFFKDPYKIQKLKSVQVAEWDIIALTDFSISIKDYKYFEWELKIDDGKGFIFTFGFIENKLETWDKDKIYKYFDLADVNSRTAIPKPYIVYFASYKDNFTLYGVNDNKIVKNSKKININDTVKLKLDFTKKNVEIYHNGNYLCNPYDTIPDSIIPMFGMWEEVTIICEKFDCY